MPVSRKKKPTYDVSRMPEKYRKNPLTYFQARNIYLMEHSGALELSGCVSGSSDQVYNKLLVLVYWTNKFIELIVYWTNKKLIWLKR